MIDADLQLALAEYRMMFAGAAGSGMAGAALGAWETEYARVKESGLSATLITSHTAEGGTSASAVKNFEQKTLLRALLLRRAELDADFDDVAFAPPAVKVRQSLGVTVVFG